MLGLISPRESSEITIEVILCKYSRQRRFQYKMMSALPVIGAGTLQALNTTAYCWAEARIKIARIILTIRLDWNWSSFQLANIALPQNVIRCDIAPSARMLSNCENQWEHITLTGTGTL